MNHPQELVLAATIHRVKSCEDKIAQFEQLISTLTAQMAYNRSELASKGLANLIMGTTTPLDIPRELRPTFGRYRARGNRSYNTVRKRWNIWKAQYESGLTVKEIANAWGCHHSSIVNAKSKNFTARKSSGRGIK